MSLEQIFSLANALALFCWILLFVLYQKRWVYQLLFSFVLTLMSVLYLVYIVKGLGDNSQGGFDTLANVKVLFSNDQAVLAGWIHYLVFDLFVGMWICHDADVRGINRWILLPCLLLTFLLGPTGFLLYYLVRVGYLRKIIQEPYSKK
jgi:hypothetical protein